MTLFLGNFVAGLLAHVLVDIANQHDFGVVLVAGPFTVVRFPAAIHPDDAGSQLVVGAFRWRDGFGGENGGDRSGCGRRGGGQQ